MREIHTHRDTERDEAERQRDKERGKERPRDRQDREMRETEQGSYVQRGSLRPGFGEKLKEWGEDPRPEATLCRCIFLVTTCNSPRTPVLRLSLYHRL